MTSDDAAIHDEWDADTLALLKYDAPAQDEPATTGELVLVPGYSQSEWDRRQVRMLQRAQDAETYLWDNLEKGSEVLVRDVLLLLGRDRAAAAWMNPDGRMVWLNGEGAWPWDGDRLTWESPTRTFVPERKTRARPSQRRRPGQARKAATGGT